MANSPSDEKEALLQEIQRRSARLKLMRNPDSMSDFGLMLVDAANFGQDDSRLIQAREAIKNTPKVLKAILEAVQIHLSANMSDAGQEKYSTLYRILYPETPVDAPDVIILGQVTDKLQAIANKTDITKH
jgi:hypothetical protein